MNKFLRFTGLATIAILSGLSVKAQTVLYSENFASGLGTTFPVNSSFGSWQFNNTCPGTAQAGHTTTGTAMFIGSGCTYGNGPSTVAGDLETPAIAITPNGATLTFNYRVNTECGAADCYFDRIRVYASTDNWVTSTLLESTYDPEGTLNADGGWHSATIPLTAYSSTNVKLRFNFNSIDGVGNANDGAYLDDIQVVSCAPTSPLSIFPASGSFTVNMPAGGSAANWVPWTYTYADQVPAGSTVTSVSLTYTARDQGWGGTGVATSMVVGGTNIGGNTLYSYSQTFNLNSNLPFPSYNYGGNNTVEMHFVGWTGWQAYWEGGSLTVNYGPAPVCEGQQVTLTASGAASYTWNNGATNATPFTPVATDYYVVTGITSGGCVYKDSAEVIVHPIPVVVANTTAAAVCDGGSVTLTGSGASTYTWNNSVTNNTAFTPTATATYIVTGTTAYGCQDTASQTVVVNTLPTVTANPVNPAVCSGNSVTLTGGGANTYTWDNGVTDGTAFNPSATATYTVTGTDGNGCTDTASTTVTVNSVPAVSASASASTVCAGTSVTLTGSGADSYTWSNGISDATPFTPTATTTYVVTGVNAAGCTDTASVTITVNPLPAVTASSTASAICDGGSVTLTGGGTVSYTWNNGVSDGVAFAPSATNTYTVTGTDANGCTNTSNTTVTVNALPVVSASASSAAVCSGNSVTLTGSGASSYAWDNGVTDGVSFTPSSTTTYNVTGTDANGCTGTASTTVTVNSNPVVSASASSPAVCAGGSVTLTGSGAVSYSWTNGVTDAVAFTPSATSGYMVIGTDANGCTGTASTTVTVNPLPTVVANTTASAICTGGSVTLTGNGATSYSWDNGVTDGVSIAPSATTTYTVTGTDANGCINTATTTVTVNPLPTVMANTSSSSICDGGSVTLTGAGASSYTWDNGVSDGVSFTPSSTTTYTVTGTDANGCAASATVTVTVNALPTVTASSSASQVCAGDSVTLSGNGAVSYAWDNGVNDGVAFAPASTLTYTVTGTGVNGCVNSATVTIPVNALPAVSANASATTVCEGSSVLLTGSGASTYNWDNGVTNWTAFTPTATAIYTVTGVDANGCSDTDTITIVVNSAPAVIANASSVSLCTGDSVVLTGSGAASYNWNNSVMDNVYFVPASTMTYTVTGTGSNGCTAIDSVMVVVNVVDATTSVNGVTLTANASGATYQWVDCNQSNQPISGETAQSFTATVNGNYAVMVTENGCSEMSACIEVTNVGIAEIQTRFIIYPNPASGIVYVESDQSGTIEIYNAQGQVVYQNTFATGKTSISTTNLSSGMYFVSLTSQQGVRVTERLTISQ